MRTKFLLTNTLLALALVPAATGARADSFSSGGGGGSANITIGSTPVSGTAGLLYSDGTYVQSLPGAFHTLDPNWTSSQGPVFDFGNDQSLSLTTDKTYATAPLTIINTNTSGGIGNLFEIYNSIGGPLNVVAYFDNGGDFFSRLSATVSGHVGGTSPHQSVLLPTNYVPYMIGAWSDITGPAFLARNNAGAAGEYSFLGLAYGGAATIALDANNTQVVFGNQTVGSGQTFTGDTFFGRVAAATFRFGAADAAAPVSQTVGVQNVLAGTSNTAGANTIFDASMGTGTGASGAFEFFTAAAGSSGTSQNALSLALKIGAGPAVTIGQGGSSTPQLTFTPNSGGSMSLGSANSGYGLIVFTGATQAFGFMSANLFGTSSSAIGFVNGSSVTGTADTVISRLGVAGLMGLGSSQGDFSGTLKLTGLITAPLTYATLPASPTAGQRAYITDGNSTTYYATVSSGGGSSKISVLYNGSNWIVD